MSVVGERWTVTNGDKPAIPHDLQVEKDLVCFDRGLNHTKNNLYGISQDTFYLFYII